MLRRSFLATAAVMMVAWGAQSFAGDEKPGTHEGKVVKVDANKLSMADKDGKNQQTNTVAADAKITLDGKDCKLADLKPGFPVRVTVEKKGDENVITKIEANKA